MKSLTLTALLLVGCFDPHYVDGGLRCAPGGECPEGFACYSGACWSHEPPVTPTPDASVPAVDGATPEAPALVRYLGQPCDAINAGTARRSDNCAGGLTCVDGNAGATCMRLCSSNSTCGDATCELRRVDANTGATASVCGPTATTCDPVARAGCPGGTTCFLQGARTICETTSGDGQQSSCLYSRECLPGYTCAASGAGAGRCFPACATTDPTCPYPAACQSSASAWSYCL